MLFKHIRFWVVIAIFLAVTPLLADSLWTADADRLFTDHKASKVGDLVTVIVAEQTTSSQSASTDVSKDLKHGSDAGIGPLLNLLPSFEFNSSQSGAASGKTTVSSDFSTKVTATISKVLPSGNFEITGERQMVTNGEEQKIILTATVRPEDIATDNTVSSSYLADVQIKCTGKGQISDRQKEGFISKLIKWIF